MNWKTLIFCAGCAWSILLPASEKFTLKSKNSLTNCSNSNMIWEVALYISECQAMRQHSGVALLYVTVS